MRHLPVMVSCLAVSAALISSAGYSQESVGSYPSKPVTFILPVGAGGPADIETRVYAGKLNASLHQPFVIDYKLGAGQSIGTVYVAKSKPDGYTLLGASGGFTAYPALFKDPPFDAIKDFAPVSQMSQNPFVMATYPSFPAKTLVEYVTYAKANPGKISFGTFGAGSITHLAGEWLHSATGTKVTYIGYKDTTTEMADVMGNRLDVLLIGLVAALPQMKAGKLRALAITTSFRSKLVPDVPTVAEQGVPGYSVPLWLGYVAPAATPAPIVNKLSAEFAKIAKESDVITMVSDNGGAALGSTPAQFRQFIATESAQWRKLVQDNGIKPE